MGFIRIIDANSGHGRFFEILIYLDLRLNFDAQLEKVKQKH